MGGASYFYCFALIPDPLIPYLIPASGTLDLLAKAGERRGNLA